MSDFMSTIMSEPIEGRKYWNEKMKEVFPDQYFDNLTDFNYSTCFTYFIGCDGCEFRLGSKELSAYLKDGNTAYYVKVQMSLREPVMCIVFCKYEGSGTAFFTSESPYTQSQQSVYRRLTELAKKNDFKIVLCSELMKKIVCISDKQQNAYNYLFEEAQ